MSEERKKWIQNLLEDLDSDLWQVSAEAAQMLGEMEAKEAIPQLIRKLLPDSDDLYQGSIILALGMLRAKEAIHLLIEILEKNPNIDIREAAACALSEIKAIEAIEPLKKALLSRKNESHRFQFAVNLARLEGKEGIGYKSLLEIKNSKGFRNYTQKQEFEMLNLELNLEQKTKNVKDELVATTEVIRSQPESNEKKESLEKLLVLDKTINELVKATEQGRSEREALRKEFFNTQRSIEDTFRKRDYLEVKGHRETLQSQINDLKKETSYIRKRADEKITIKDEFSGAWKTISFIALILGGLGSIVSIVLIILKIIEVTR